MGSVQISYDARRWNGYAERQIGVIWKRRKNVIVIWQLLF